MVIRTLGARLGISGYVAHIFGVVGQWLSVSSVKQLSFELRLVLDFPYRLKSRSLLNFQKRKESNCISWSPIINAGTPKRGITSSTDGLSTKFYIIQRYRLRTPNEPVDDYEAIPETL